MEPNELEKNIQKIDPEILGSSLEKEKEAVVDQTADQEAAARKYVEERKKKQGRKVGIKTYRDYAAEELKKGGGTLTTMIVQEREKEREQKRHSVKNSKNLLVTFLAVLFVCAGIGIVGVSFVLVKNTQQAAQIRDGFIVAPKPLLSTDFRKELYIPEPNRARITRAVQSDIEETAIPIGSIKHMYLVQDGEDVPKVLTTSGQFFRAMDVQIPGALERAIDPLFMYGSYSSTGISPFLLFTVSSYATAYAELLKWEDDIIRDLEPMFAQDLSSLSRSNFEDLVLYNTDVRAILDNQGEVLFGYGFLQDKKTLVFFDNRLTLREIITRNQRNTIKE